MEQITRSPRIVGLRTPIPSQPKGLVHPRENDVNNARASPVDLPSRMGISQTQCAQSCLNTIMLTGGGVA